MTDLRVTFITPHLNATSGGAQEIINFVRHLRPHADATLAVMQGPFDEIPGVKVARVPNLAAEELPVADVLVVYAGLPTIDRVYALPASRGVPILWLAGHHPFVRENLQRARRTLALAPWLVAEARALGCHATYVERAIDRDVWFAGPSQLERAPVVTIMVHRSEEKGTADALSALEIVHKRFPDAELHSFGDCDDFETALPMTNHGELTPPEVADLLRQTAVFVWPSWAEGFGLPGMEALACGAALATTDTGGRRGYAQDQITALVTPIREPERLADGVVRLLQDPRLRQRLAEAGLEHAEKAYLDWPEAGARLASTLRKVGAAAAIWRPREPVEGDSRAIEEPIGPSAYLRLLKGSLLGAVHQDVHAIVRDPETLVDRDTLATLAVHDVALVRRQSGEARDRQIREGHEWPVAAETMIGEKRLGNLHQLLIEITRLGVPGDLIEAGVWRGGATIFMRGFLAAYGIPDRDVWVADSFEGLPEPDAERYPADAGDRHHEVPFLRVDLETVRQNFRRYGLLDGRVNFLKGYFKDTLPTLAGHPWALIRLDGDMYESTMDGLVNLYPSLTRGGFVIIDDYGAIPGAKQAVDDYRREHGIETRLSRVDWTGVYWRKFDP